MFLRTVALVSVLVFSGCAALVPFIDAPAPTRTGTPIRVSYFAPPARTEHAPSEKGPESAMENRTTISARASRSDDLYVRLINQLKSGNAAERTCAATDLAQMRGRRDESIRHLSYALRNDQSKWVRRAAAKSLGKIGTSAVIAPLTAALRDRDKWVAHSAANALSNARRASLSLPRKTSLG